METGIRSVNHLLAERQLPLLESKEDYRRVFGFPIRRYYERLGFDFEREPYEVIAPLWVEQYMKNVKDATMFDDVVITLERLREMKIRQVVLSATELGMLRGQLTQLGIIEYFEEILGLDNIHAASKLELARDWRARHPKATAVFLGDTDHDCETAKAMNVPCILIARGHQSAEQLESLGVPLAGSLRALL